MTTGGVYLVGAGPGDLGLLTLRARELIEIADVLVYDYLVNERLLDWCKENCEKIYVGKKPGFHAISQDEIEDIIVKYAREGKTVVRLKGGDPFIFGRGGEEALRMTADGISYEIVPGVTAALATAAYAGVPLTHRDISSSISILTGHENIEKHESRVSFRDFAKTAETLCIYMGMGRLATITVELMEGGLSPDTPVVVVQWATLPRQRSLLATLSTVTEECRIKNLSNPSVIVVGKVSQFYNTMGWFERKPLFGKRIVVTRSRQQSADLSRKLEVAGAEVMELPLIQIKMESDVKSHIEIFAGIGVYDWIVFTSANGAECFFNIFFKTFTDIRSFGFLKIAAVGTATEAEINKYHLKVDLVPDTAVAEELVEALVKEESIEHQKILVVTGNRNRDVIVKKLEEAMAIVDTMTVYKTEKTDLSQHPTANIFRQEGADAVTFTSSSTVQSFVEQAASLQLEKDAQRPITCSIGPITSETMRKAGMPVDAEAKYASIDGMIEALIDKFNSENDKTE